MTINQIEGCSGLMFIVFVPMVLMSRYGDKEPWWLAVVSGGVITLAVSAIVGIIMWSLEKTLS